MDGTGLVTTTMVSRRHHRRSSAGGAVPVTFCTAVPCSLQVSPALVRPTLAQGPPSQLRPSGRGTASFREPGLMTGVFGLPSRRAVQLHVAREVCTRVLASGRFRELGAQRLRADLNCPKPDICQQQRSPKHLPRETEMCFSSRAGTPQLNRQRWKVPSPPQGASGFGVESVRVVADPVPRVLAHLLEPELRRPPGQG